MSILERARKEGTPLIDGYQVTFVWHGEGDPPRLSADFNDWSKAEYPVMIEQVEDDLWTYTLTLPTDAYIEYNFEHPNERVGDPFNKHVVDSGVGHDQHAFAMPGWSPDPVTAEDDGQYAGQVRSLTLKAAALLSDGERGVTFYKPPTDDPVPLLVVFDGNDYADRGRLLAIVDRMITAGRIEPLALAMLDNHHGNRFIEYGCSDVTAALVAGPLMQLAGNILNLIDAREQPGVHGILGASMGGVMALYTALRAPHIFGRVISQSGAFSIGFNDFVVYDLVRYGPKHDIRVWMDVGQFDFPVIHEANPRMRDLLTEQGYDVTYREFSAGHNYPAWRADIWRGLEALFKES